MPSLQKTTQLSIGRVASLACLLEVCASKPGNVHRGADFENATLNDFVVSAELLGQTIDSRKCDELGLLVVNAVKARLSLVTTNTNLGIILLLAPLAIVANDGELSANTIRRFLKTTSAEDAQNIYDAIRLAQPGGLGQSENMDVNESAPQDIVSAMKVASDRDLVAMQYTNNFQHVFEEVVPLLTLGQSQFESINEAIVYAHVSMIARHGDSLIRRKCGEQDSEHAKMLACRCLEPLIEDDREKYYAAIGELDFWLRANGNQRNPGTTADLITAGIFVGIVNENIVAPFR